MKDPRCFVVSQSNQWFRGFCRDAGVNPKSKQIICVTYDTAVRMLANFDADNDFIVFLSHWNDCLNWNQSEAVIREVNHAYGRAKDLKRRIIRHPPA